MGNPMFNLSYGLFVITTQYDHHFNGCIINTATQITATPNRMMVAINKNNFTHDLLVKGKEYNISILSVGTPFDVFKQFGFQSGKEVDKFVGLDYIDTAKNNIPYLKKYANSYLSVKVTDMIEYETHTVFIGEVTDMVTLSDQESATYAYYFKHIKPSVEVKKKGWVCKVCGFIYEGDVLPDDYICPICKHGAEDFEPIQ